MQLIQLLFSSSRFLFLCTATCCLSFYLVSLWCPLLLLRPPTARGLHILLFSDRETLCQPLYGLKVHMLHATYVSQPLTSSSQAHLCLYCLFTFPEETTPCPFSSLSWNLYFSLDAIVPFLLPDFHLPLRTSIQFFCWSSRPDNTCSNICSKSVCLCLILVKP